MSQSSKPKPAVSRRETVGTQSIDALFAAVSIGSTDAPPPNARNAIQLAAIWRVSVGTARLHAEEAVKAGKMVLAGTFRDHAHRTPTRYWLVK